MDSTGRASPYMPVGFYIGRNSGLVTGDTNILSFDSGFSDSIPSSYWPELLSSTEAG